MPDKFKGTLTAKQASRMIGRGWRRTRPNDVVRYLPISDGGDGFGEVLSRIIGAERQNCLTVDAAHRRVRAAWWWHSGSRTAIIESARVIGLARLPPGKYHPFDLDSRGLAAMLVAAKKHEAQRCILGIGGSATNDGGFGLAAGLGWRFLKGNGDRIEKWTDLHSLDRFEAPASGPRFRNLIVAVDVQNPLLGFQGATRVYGPQKGLAAEDVDHAEKCLRRLARVAANQFNHDKSKMPGAGAAGGLGFGLAIFTGAVLRPGFDLIARKARLRGHIRQSDLVITGEGKIDASTMMGKAVGEIAALCNSLDVPCIGLGGSVQLSDRARRKFVVVRALSELTSLDQAMKKSIKWLERLASDVALKLPRYL